jgi:hypothetical protein
VDDDDDDDRLWEILYGGNLTLKLMTSDNAATYQYVASDNRLADALGFGL